MGLGLKLRHETNPFIIKLIAEPSDNEAYLTYSFAEPIPKGLGPEDFIGAVVEIDRPWKKEDDEYKYGGRYSYAVVSHVSVDYNWDSDSNVPEDEEDRCIVLRCVGQVCAGDWAFNDSDIIIVYYPSENASSWNKTYVSEFIGASAEGDTIWVELTKTIDSSTGDVTYEGTSSDKDSNVVHDAQSLRTLLTKVHFYCRNEGNTDGYFTARLQDKKYKTKLYLLSNYYWYHHDQITDLVSEIKETNISTGVYKYNYHIKFTVPAANVISIN